MTNPWLAIPLADYEAHMALPTVGQAQLLSYLLEVAIAAHRPQSIAVLGCAGGNGFDRIPASVERVVGIDVNPEYVAAARTRFGTRLPALELIVGEAETCSFAPVDLLFAGLVLEYVDLPVTLRCIRGRIRPGGVLVTVLQLPNAAAVITPSAHASSLEPLAAAFRFIPPTALVVAAERCGLAQTAAVQVTASGGKSFQVQTFRPNQ